MENNSEIIGQHNDDVLREREQSLIIPVIEERVYIEKKLVDKAKTIVSKSVQEHDEMVKVSLNHEEVHIEHIPVNQYVDGNVPTVRYEGDTMIIPVLNEVVFVEKRIMLIEEVRITKRQVQTEESHNVTLRKETIDVRRTEIEGSGGPLL